MHDTRICCIKLRSLLQVEFVRSFLSSACRAEHICILTGTDCDRVQRSVIRIVNCWISEQFSRVRNSSRVRVHQHPSSFTLHTKNIKSGCGASVTVYVMSGTEGQELGGIDPLDLLLPRGAIGSGREQTTPQSTAIRLIDKKSLLQVTPNHRRQGKFSCLEMVFLDYSASNQQTTK